MLAATYQIFIAPLVERVHAPADPTYGRYLLPLSPFEAALAADTELCADIRRRRVFIEVDGSIGSGEDITFTKTDLKRGRGKKWVHYQVWTSSQGEKGVAAGCDIVLVHGLGDYGGEDEHVSQFEHKSQPFSHRKMGLSCHFTSSTWVPRDCTRFAGGKDMAGPQGSTATTPTNMNLPTQCVPP
ncbi:hypothetical protein FRB94_002530 [Tulasnella sp. JGI-2019a]|nr:hypothetical protein FRB94_002530 [Tulasnella sp. JGI-2019a]